METTAALLLTLPVEMIHRIFNELDGTTLFLSVRNVCQQLRTAVDTHQRYALDLTSISKPDFHRLVRVIRPERVTGLKLTNAELTPGLIGVLLSCVDIGLFTRLRSLTALNMNREELFILLDHAERCSLTSLVLFLMLRDFVDHEQIVRQLAAIIEQPTLVHIELRDGNLSKMMDHFQWPIQCKVRYLEMAY
jgi:hypothetical protein